MADRDSRALWPGMAALALGVGNFLLVTPGELSSDSIVQLDEARSGHFSDWHSPFTGHLWRLMLSVHDAPWTMLALQLGAYWAGAGLLANALARSGRVRQAWAVIAVSLFPHFLYFNHYILKDTALYSAAFLGTSLCYMAAFGNRQHAIRNYVLASLVLAACALIRVNGVFAVAALAAGMLMIKGKFTLPRFLVGALCGSVALVLVVRWVNTTVLAADESDVVQSLQIFDLMGIQHFSRDATVWRGHSISNADVDNCYTPYYWDTFSPTGVCSPLRARIGAADGKVFSPEGISARRSLWVAAILAHPGAYAWHRLQHYNSETFFAVPALHARFNKAIRDGRGPGWRPLTDADVRFDFLKKSLLVWPATWMATGLAAMLLLWPRLPLSRQARFGMTLLGSGLLYGLAYAVIGVASDVRYFLWTTLAVMLAAVVAWPDFRVAWSEHPGRRAWGVGGVAAVVAIGMACRLA